VRRTAAQRHRLRDELQHPKGGRQDRGADAMDNGLLVGLSRQTALERQFDVVANNIANLNTFGFKSTSSVFEEYLTSDARENEFGAADAQVRFVSDRTSFRNFDQGPIQQTGNPLDIALDGNAFLAVQVAGGERYTRNGALHINADGELVTADGDRVAGDNGPIVFQATDRNISISADGRLSVIEGANTSVESLRGKLKLVSFAQPQQLQAEGATLFSAPAGLTQQAATGIRVIQGAVEGSNVNGVLEMTRMIEINRTYTLINAMLKSRDDEQKNTIDKLAQVPS
jgi:flagellar basal-body rod protein FlgF